jgi:hypothetical protein
MVVVSYLMLIGILTSAVRLMVYGAEFGGGMRLAWLDRINAIPYDYSTPLVASLVVTTALGLTLLFGWGKSLLMRSASEEVARDPRPYVLYLRSFKADTIAGAIPEHGDTDRFSGFRVLMNTPLVLIRQAIRLLSPRLYIAPPLTEEEQIVRAFRDIGPVITVGTPGERLPPPGAARLYIGDRDWKESVAELVCSAGAVVVRISESAYVAPRAIFEIESGAGLTASLEWEIASVIREVPPQQLFFLVACNDGVYGRFKAEARESFPQGLPALVGLEGRRGAVRAVIGFEEDWQPHLHSLSRADTSLFRAVRYPVTSAIRDKLKALRDGSDPRPVRRAVVAGVLITAVFFGLPLAIGLARLAPASQLMLITRSSSQPTPLFQAMLPRPSLDQVRFSTDVPVVMMIDSTGKVISVRVGPATPFSFDGEMFVKRMIESWRFVPVQRFGHPFGVITRFVYRVRPIANMFTLGRDQITLHGSASRAEGEALANALRQIGYLRNLGTTVDLSRGPNGAMLSFVVKDGVSNIPAVISAFWEIARDVAPSVGGLPLKVRLMNNKGEVRREIPIPASRSVIVGAKDKLYYSGSLTEAQALSVGKTLRSAHYFRDRGGIAEVSRGGDGVVVLSFIVSEGVWKQDKVVASYLVAARAIAATLGGVPVRLRLLDLARLARREITVLP